MASGWRSWPPAATAGPSCGCPTAGPGSQAEGWDAPLYWEPGEDGDWRVMSLGGLVRSIPTPRSPTSAISRPTPTPAGPASGCRPRRSGSTPSAGLATGGGLRDLDRIAPRPAGPAGGLRQMFGDLWQWTASAYAPYPGFVPGAGRGRRVQRQVHGQPDGAARRMLRHPARPCARQLPQLLLSAPALDVFRRAPGRGRPGLAAPAPRPGNSWPTSSPASRPVPGPCPANISTTSAARPCSRPSASCPNTI